MAESEQGNLNDSGQSWLRQPEPGRPIYQCPQCRALAMQFFRELPEGVHGPERSNSFVCLDCGASWEQ
jgi:hypothetical protein